MATREENLQFLEAAKSAVEEIQAMKAESEEQAVRLKRMQKDLDSETRVVNDTITETIKKRRAELIKPFDSQIGDLQSSMRKEQSKREKARSVGMKTRIEHETAHLTAESKELNNRIKMISSRNGVPGYCNTSLFSIMSSPKGIKEILIFVGILMLLFAVIPIGSWMIWGNKSTLWLIIAYIVCIAVFGGLYYLLVLRLKISHSEELKEIALLRDQRALKKDAIDRITKGIQNDQNDAVYNLGEFDARIAELEEQIGTLEQQKKAAAEQFDTVTQKEISDEILGRNAERLEQMKNEIDAASGGLEALNARLRNAGVENTTRYESVLGTEFSKPVQIERLGGYIRSGQANTIEEAKELYRAGAKLQVTEPQ